MSVAYRVQSMFLTLQGEGANTGRRAVFCRLKFCNLWTGVESDRSKAVCQFCDTDFISDGTHGGRYHAVSLASKAAELWGAPDYLPRFMVITGGEPTLQVDDWLIGVLHRWHFEVAIETNGTRPVPEGVDWITVSPKAGAELVQNSGDELKLVYPQPGAEPERFADLPFVHRYLQPMDGPEREKNTAAAIEYCLANPAWKLSLQTHKFVGIR